jgi:hypothetical protein
MEKKKKESWKRRVSVSFSIPHNHKEGRLLRSIGKEK